MNIKTQISILCLSKNAAVYKLESDTKVHNFIWKDENDLLKQIEDIITAFSDSSEAITPANSIKSAILNQYADRITTFGGMVGNFFGISNPEIDDAVKKAMKSIIDEQNSKKGRYSITLNEDEMYGLFSLSEFRKMKLDQIL